MGTDDASLAAQAVAGDQDALSALLARYGPAVERTLQISAVWRALLEPADVMQVTYLEAFIEIRRFDPAHFGAFPAWLRRIADNNLRDALRGLESKKRPQPARRVEPGGSDDSFAALHDQLFAVSATASRDLAVREARQRLTDAIGRLPPDYATVVRMYDLEGRSIDNVAAAVQRTPGAVYMLRARAHERLQRLLGSASQYFRSSA